MGAACDNHVVLRRKVAQGSERTGSRGWKDSYTREGLEVRAFSPSADNDPRGITVTSELTWTRSLLRLTYLGLLNHKVCRCILDFRCIASTAMCSLSNTHNVPPAEDLPQKSILLSSLHRRLLRRIDEMSTLTRRACYKCGNVGHYAGQLNTLTFAEPS